MFAWIVAIWVAFAFWPARIAARQGYSFRGYLIFSLLFWPAAMIVACSLEDRTTVAPDSLAPTPV